MNYYALFLENESYIEKCLILIKHLSSPSSKSLPHITLRLFRKQDSKLDYIRDLKISYLNIIEPGSFNMDSSSGQYVVYLRCESEELEEIDYRPDYPFSRLHITLYEGNDYIFASSLYEELNSISWHFKLVFDLPKHLSEQTLGTGYHEASYYNSLGKEIIGEDYSEANAPKLNNEGKLRLIKVVINNLEKYLHRQDTGLERIGSLYSDNESTNNANNFIDESLKSSSVRLDDQLMIQGFPPIDVVKPVQDAIFVTPPEYARDMAQFAIEAFGDDSKRIRFGDSAIGTGALFIAIRRLIDNINNETNTKYEFSSAIGVDIDEKMATEAFFRCSKRGLVVIYGDALSQDINLGERRNMMIVNPPYNRHTHIPDDYRKLAMELAKEQTGIQITANAGLYVYHLLIMDKWLCDDGIAVWLLPSIFLQSRYGKAIRQYLTQNVQLLRLHIYNEEKLQFGEAMISTTIVVFKKRKPSELFPVIITYGDTVDNPQFKIELKTRSLRDNLQNWRSLFVDANTALVKPLHKPLEIKFSDLFSIKRGIATGANSFFVLKLSDAEKNGIPGFALKPILPKARYLTSLIIESKDNGYPAVDPQMVLIDCDLNEDDIRNNYPLFFEYLQTAKVKDKNGKAIVDRALVKARSPWYKQESRTPPLFLLTYMGRNKEKLPPLYFLLNKSNAVALNTYLLLYPKDWLLNYLNKNRFMCEKLLISLNKTAESIVSRRTRIYSGGLRKLEPNELKNLPLEELPEKIISEYDSTRQDL